MARVLTPFVTTYLKGLFQVGEDLWGDKYIANLKEQKVETKYVQKTPNFSSGIAQITVAETGDNQIVIVAGANTQLSPLDVEKAKSEISAAAVLVLQLETSVEVAVRALELCAGVSGTWLQSDIEGVF